MKRRYIRQMTSDDTEAETGMVPPKPTNIKDDSLHQKLGRGSKNSPLHVSGV